MPLGKGVGKVGVDAANTDKFWLVGHGILASGRRLIVESENKANKQTVNSSAETREVNDVGGEKLLPGLDEVPWGGLFIARAIGGESDRRRAIGGERSAQRAMGGDGKTSSLTGRRR